MTRIYSLLFTAMYLSGIAVARAPVTRAESFNKTSLLQTNHISSSALRTVTLDGNNSFIQNADAVASAANDTDRAANPERFAIAALLSNSTVDNNDNTAT